MGLLKYYSIGEFAKAIGKTTKTLRNWYKNGKLKYNKKGLKRKGVCQN